MNNGGSCSLNDLEHVRHRRHRRRAHAQSSDCESLMPTTTPRAFMSINSMYPLTANQRNSHLICSLSISKKPNYVYVIVVEWTLVDVRTYVQDLICLRIDSVVQLESFVFDCGFLQTKLAVDLDSLIDTEYIVITIRCHFTKILQAKRLSM
jgi:hypothetical protein